MITIEKLNEVLEGTTTFQKKGIDYGLTALTLLRDKIPYDVCNKIIASSAHDQIFMCRTEDVLPYIDEIDAEILGWCNVFIDTDWDVLSMFV